MIDARQTSSPHANTVFLAIAVGIVLAQGIHVSAAQSSAPMARLTASQIVQAGTTTGFKGAGFLPGETVTFQVTHVDGTAVVGSNHTPASVAADFGGAFGATWLVCATDCVGELLQIEAIGQTSGKVGRAFFRDLPAPPGSGTGASVAGPGHAAGPLPGIPGTDSQPSPPKLVQRWGRTSNAIGTDAPGDPTFERLKSFGSRSPGAYPIGVQLSEMLTAEMR